MCPHGQKENCNECILEEKISSLVDKIKHAERVFEEIEKIGVDSYHIKKYREEWNE